MRRSERAVWKAAAAFFAIVSLCLSLARAVRGDAVGALFQFGFAVASWWVFLQANSTKVSS